MRISDWSSDVCSSDLGFAPRGSHAAVRSLYRMCLSLRHAGQRDPSHEAGMPVYYQSRRRYDLAASYQVHCLRSDERRVGKEGVSVDLGGRRIIKKKKRKKNTYIYRTMTYITKN